MDGLLLHLSVMTVTFAAVSVGAYGLLRQLSDYGMLPLERGAGRSAYRELAHRLGRLALDRGWFAPLRRVAQRDLIQARMVDVSPDDFIGGAMANAVLTALVTWAFTIALGGAPYNVIPAAVLAVVAFQMPGWNLRNRANNRIAEIGRRLPYSLEVIVLAMESGSGFEEALALLAREDPKNPLHEEFDQVLRDGHLGRNRRESLNAMVQRVPTEDLRSLVMALDLSEELGTGLAGTLKKQAEAIRASRVHRAERLAREAGPKMAVPNTMIMLANVLLILAPFLPRLTNFSGV